MQFISGQSLQQRLDKSGPLAVAEILRIGMQTAEGLAAAHEQGLVHRDIKPANILLENGVERVKITDFGLARAVDDASLTRSGVVAGTPLYMAPEQARGEPVDHRADLFSLGCVLYTLATGRPPFRAATTVAVLRRICEDEARPIRELNAEIPDWLSAIADKLLAKDPAQRYSNAGELAELLAGCLAHVQRPGSVALPSAVAAPLPPVSNEDRPLPETRRQSWLLTTPAGIAVLLLAAIAPFVLALLCAGIGVFAHWLDSSQAVPGQRGWEVEPPPVVRDNSRVNPSQAELDELRRLVGIAETEMQLSRERFDAGHITAHECAQAEIAFWLAKARYSRAIGQFPERLEALRRIVSLREKIVEFAELREKAAVAPPTERLAAERALSEAKLELQAAEAEIAPRQ
jgi:serine/threonine protein kinase